jgi:ferredoxin
MITFTIEASPLKETHQPPLSVPCLRTLNILAHAQMEELDIGSICGGHGFCGGDRILLLKDSQKVSPITDKERKHLSPEELQAGWRLGCQCWPEANDLDISISITR